MSTRAPAATGPDNVGRAGDAATAGGEVGLDVVSVDRSVPGELRLRVATPVGESAAISSDSLVATVAGLGVDAEVRPVVADSMQVAVVVDISGSMEGDALAAAKASVMEFIDALPDTAEVALITFGPQSNVVQAPTTDRQAVLGAVDNLVAGGETALYDGIMDALELPAEASRLPVVVLSDGGDTASTTSLDELLDVVATAPHRIYPIALATDEANTGTLEQLASVGRGRLATADDPAALAQLYNRLAATLSSEYEVVVPVDREGPATIALTVEADETTGQPSMAWSQVIDLPDIPGHSEAMSRVVEAPATRTVAEPGLTASADLLPVAGGFMVVAVLLAVVFSLTGGGTSRHRGLNSRPSSQSLRLEDFRAGTARAVEGAMQNGKAANLARQLDMAGLKMRVGELIMIDATLAVILGLLAGFLFGPLAVVVGAVVGLLLPGFYLRLRRRRRSRAFQNQLADILVALANVLRVGFSMNRGLLSVARESEEPAHSELNRAIMEARVGGDLIQALRGVADRTASTDLVWVVDAIEINMAVGGDMVAVLETVAETVRSRVTLHAQIAALTAEGRLSALVLMLLPPGLTVFIFLSNPAYFDGIWSNPLAYPMAGSAVGALVIGGLWIRKMIGAVG